MKKTYKYINGKVVEVKKNSDIIFTSFEISEREKQYIEDIEQVRNDLRDAHGGMSLEKAMLTMFRIPPEYLRNDHKNTSTV